MSPPQILIEPGRAAAILIDKIECLLQQSLRHQCFSGFCFAERFREFFNQLKRQRLVKRRRDVSFL